METVDRVHSHPGGRIHLSFLPHHIEVRTSPTVWRDWVRRFWWSALGGLALAWAGTLLHSAGAPKAVAIALAAPGGLIFACLCLYALAALVIAVFTLGLGEANMAWLGRWVDRRAKPTMPLGMIPAGAVARVRTERKFRRTVAHVTFADGRTIRYTRWGGRGAGRPMAERFQAMATVPQPR